MVLTADYHTHTTYSHGKNTVLENAEHAAAIGLKQIAISDHGFLHLAHGIKRKDVPAFSADCKEAEERCGISVLRGIEANVGGVLGRCDLTEKDYENFDVYLCGYHLTTIYNRLGDVVVNGWGNILHAKYKFPASKGLIQRNTKAYIQTLKNHPIDVLTHLGFQCECDALEVAKCAADLGTYIELNAKKEHLSDER